MHGVGFVIRMCKEICTKEEYLQLKTAFFEKEKNLERIMYKDPTDKYVIIAICSDYKIITEFFN